MLIPKIAFRNIFRQKRRSLLTGLMMAIGFALLSITIGLMDGSYSNIINMFTLDHTGHVQIHKRGYLERPSIYKTITDSDNIEQEVLNVPKVVSAAPRVYSVVLALLRKKTTGVRIMGVDPAKEKRTTRLPGKVKEGKFLPCKSPNEVVVSEGLKDVLGAKLGDEIALIGQGARGGMANDLFTIVGFTDDNDSSGLMTCYLDIRDAQRFLELGDKVHEIAVVLENYKYARRTADLISSTLASDSLEVHPWQVVEEQFYRAMKADCQGSYVSLLVVMIIIAIGVLNTVLMTVLERTREFGLLKAIGTRPLAIIRLIILETAFLAFISIIVGMILGTATNYWLSIHGIKYPIAIEWGGFTFDRMLSVVTWQTIWEPALLTFLTAIIVSIPPGIRAARITPVKAMRQF